MVEYIDKEAMLGSFDKRVRLLVGDKTVSIEAIREFLKNRPVVDVVSVVRCKDCEYFLPPDNKCVFTACSYIEFGRMFAPRQNDFCSYGRKKK